MSLRSNLPHLLFSRPLPLRFPGLAGNLRMVLSAMLATRCGDWGGGDGGPQVRGRGDGSTRMRGACRLRRVSRNDQCRCCFSVPLEALLGSRHSGGGSNVVFALTQAVSPMSPASLSQEEKFSAAPILCVPWPAPPPRDNRGYHAGQARAHIVRNLLGCLAIVAAGCRPIFAAAPLPRD